MKVTKGIIHKAKFLKYRGDTIYSKKAEVSLK